MSNEKQESLADIIAQMRGNEWDAPEFDRYALQTARKLACHWADRLEAALKREKAKIEADALAVGGIVEAERHKPGNAAAMREALLRCEAISHLPEIREQQCVKDMRNIVTRALAAPPRNCDSYDVEDGTVKCMQAIDAAWHEIDTIRATIDWMLATAEPETKGETNGSK